MAYALDGHPPQIIVSEGLAASLTDDELAAVIRHEQSHLHHDHQRYLDLAVAVDAALPPLRSFRRSSATLRLAVERWADESAAEHGDRAHVRHALRKVVGLMLSSSPVTAFTAAETVAARIWALDEAASPSPALRWRVAAALPTATLGLAVVIALLTADSPLHTLLGLGGLCPM
jgi:Zn-dependent protease with chaperone function